MMKVIDLLNKIANGEIETNIEFFYKKEKYRHIDSLFGDYYVEEVLNEEVEIIEEDKKIDKDIKWYFIESQEQEKTKIAQINMNFKILREKLTEIIDYLEESK